jgi:hypothetical protein
MVTVGDKIRAQIPIFLMERRSRGHKLSERFGLYERAVLLVQ